MSALDACGRRRVHRSEKKRRRGGLHVTDVTADARRAAGQWPTGENLIEQHAARIGEADEKATDPRTERSSRHAFAIAI